jgi:hypothetical protein
MQAAVMTKQKASEGLHLVELGASEVRMPHDARLRTRPYSLKSFIGHSAAASGVREMLSRLIEEFVRNEPPPLRLWRRIRTRSCWRRRSR